MFCNNGAIIVSVNVHSLNSSVKYLICLSYFYVYVTYKRVYRSVPLPALIQDGFCCTLHREACSFVCLFCKKMKHTIGAYTMDVCEPFVSGRWAGGRETLYREFRSPCERNTRVHSRANLSPLYNVQN